MPQPEYSSNDDAKLFLEERTQHTLKVTADAASSLDENLAEERRMVLARFKQCVTGHAHGGSFGSVVYLLRIRAKLTAAGFEER